MNLMMLINFYNGTNGFEDGQLIVMTMGFVDILLFCFKRIGLILRLTSCLTHLPKANGISKSLRVAGLYIYIYIVECQHLALIISEDVISVINSDRNDSVFVVYMNCDIW